MSLRIKILYIAVMQDAATNMTQLSQAYVYVYENIEHFVLYIYCIADSRIIVVYMVMYFK